MSRPVLTTPRLVLRRFTMADAAALVALDADPEVVRHTRAGLAGTAPSLVRVRTETLPAMLALYVRHRHRGFWAAEEAGRFVGWFHLLPVPGDPGAAELGFRLCREAWGRGLATEGARALVETAFARWGVRRVVASALLANAASIRVLEKAGLRPSRRFLFAGRHPAIAFARPLPEGRGPAQDGGVFGEIGEDALATTMDATVETWTVTKPAVSGTRGLVATQHHRASAIGAKVLAEGGNAVDAAIAASFALGALEPWMSGLGGGGLLLIAPRDGPVEAVDFGMIAPRALEVADYPLAEGSGGDLFAWPSVIGNRNVEGPLSIAVPGQVAGMGAVHARFASRPWADLLALAVALAREGLAVDWYASLKITGEAASLSRHEESARTYLPEGFPPAPDWEGALPRLRLGRLAETLARLAEAGADDFYRGEIAAAVVADLHRLGARLSAADLATYRAHIGPALATDYRGARVHSAPGLTAGPTMMHALGLLEARLDPGTAPDLEAYTAYARSFLDAYAERLASLGDTSGAPSCTTHLSVIDAEGTLVALTQTLLSGFGSRVMLPATGIMMNNGVMWFDPRPGRPNSIAPGKRPLSNMCPAIVLAGGGAGFAVGASGGRRILPAVSQIVSFLVDYGMAVDAAFRQPRIDVSGSDTVTADRALGAEMVDGLAERFAVRAAAHAVAPSLFACPCAVARDRQGRQSGAAFVMSPWAAVAAA